MTVLYNILNYFHKDDRYNRVTLGLNAESPTVRRFMRWRYADFIFLGVLFVIYMMDSFLQPFQRQFTINDETISHPFAESERVSNAGLFFYSLLVPVCTVTGFSLVFTKPENKLYVTYISLLGVGVSWLTTGVATDILKNWIGRHRPDFLARCIPKPDTPKDIMVFAKDVCTTENKDLLLDGFRTTPSGHSSLSFAGLGYLSLWLAGQLIVRHHHLGAWRSIVALAPAFGALLIAISRTEDYRHHFIDILIGSLLGLVICYWSYFRYFPGLNHPQSFKPVLLIKEKEEQLENPPYEPVEHV